MGHSTLGRGFEEVSHLFLSNSAGAPAGEQTTAGTPDRTAARPATRMGLTACRPGAPPTKEQVAATIRECPGVLGDDMVTVGAGIVCSPFGEIDLFAFDRAHQLAIIEVQTKIDDGMIARGLSHVDWAVRNLPTVRRLYPTWAIDMTRPPRLVLVAPRFSLALRSGIRQIAAPAVSCFRYCALDLAGEAGLLIERI